jgi:putative acetyltransferase
LSKNRLGPGVNREAVSLTLRPATAADAVAMIDLHFAAVHMTAAGAYPSDVLDSWSPLPDEARYEDMRRAIANGEELLVVAECLSQVVGFGSIVPHLGELRAVYVHPSDARRTVGSQLLSRLEELAVSHGLRTLNVTASTNAERFYSRAGYEIVRRDVHQLRNVSAMDCFRMRKRLVPVGPNAIEQDDASRPAE